MNPKLFGCQPVLLSPDDSLKAILEFICSEANKLTNCGIYYARQLYFKAKQWIAKHSLSYEYKSNKHYQVLHSQAAQQTLISVYESFKSYRGLLKLWNQGELPFKPKMPNYRKKGGLAVVSYPRQALKLKGGMIRVPLGTLCKTWFDVDSFTIPMPSNLQFADIKELRIVPRNGCFYAEFVYRQEAIKVDVDSLRVLGIDTGLNNWLTCISNVGTGFIVDGLQLKSVNRWYNKQISTLKEGKPQGFWSKRLASITEKRNRQMRDAVNKAARIVINHCIENRIGRIVFGWNQGQKNEANLGNKTNQKFVQVPTARLKARIAQLCEQYGIEFVETEESYTSQASFVDADVLPTIGAKPEGWRASGKRTKRGLYRTASNQYINADANGAANILRKVSMTLGFDLSGVSRGALTHPTRIRFWVTAQKKSEAMRLQPVA